MDVFLLCMVPPRIHQSDCFKLFLTKMESFIQTKQQVILYDVVISFDARSLHLSTKFLHIFVGSNYKGQERIPSTPKAVTDVPINYKGE